MTLFHNFHRLCLSGFLAIAVLSTISLYSSDPLQDLYIKHFNTRSDINEHISILHDLAKECASVTEIGIRDVVSTWGCLQGLSESPYGPRSYVGIDISSPPQSKLLLAERLAKKKGISFRFICANDMNIEIEPSDMLFIDSLHTYCHLTYELEKFSPKIHKFIAMHDTSDPWGSCDDSAYRGDYSEYPASFNRNQKGLWAAVEDFLANHSEWRLLERRVNNHGLTILERIEDNP